MDGILLASSNYGKRRAVGYEELAVSYPEHWSLGALEHWFPRQMKSEKRAQKFHTDDPKLPRSG